eukprot:5906411-Pleurochrysis_carterae.AAC.3
MFQYSCHAVVGYSLARAASDLLRLSKDGKTEPSKPSARFQRTQSPKPKGRLQGSEHARSGDQADAHGRGCGQPKSTRVG